LSDRAAADIQDLASFGYRQELDRSLGSFSSFAASFSYISILTGVFQMFYLGFAMAGPAFFWTWPVVLMGQFSVALGFAELAAHYPLSGGIYQWSRRVSTDALGWMTGWIYLACSVISLAAVALALQATLPQVDPVFQLVGDGSNATDRARNAVILGCVLIGVSTLINAAGVRLMARINNLGVFSELIGVAALIVLLLASARHSPWILLQKGGRGAGGSSWLTPLLAAAVMPGYVLYGFDTAGSLAEETTEPRRRGPHAILRALGAAGLAGGLLIGAGILAAPDPAQASLGDISGGLPLIVKQTLGPRLGGLFLANVVLAIVVCALAVHAATVRLIFAMARDRSLPLARVLARVPTQTRTPLVPALLSGLIAALILIVNVNLPTIIETLCSVAIVWANLAYLLVSLPLLRMRLRGWPANLGDNQEGEHSGAFSLGFWGPAINLVAVCWGVFVVVNMSWPRPEVYGRDPWGRYAALTSTVALVGLGAIYYLAVQRKGGGILAEHAAPRPEPGDRPSLTGPLEWGARLASEE
jgi:urea carboxylase system permease